MRDIASANMGLKFARTDNINPAGDCAKIIRQDTIRNASKHPDYRYCRGRRAASTDLWNDC
jgi:hypothetical protein